MIRLLRRLSSAVTIVLGVGLLLSCMIWLISNIVAPTEKHLRYLPVRHLSMQLGSFELEITPCRLAVAGLSASVVLLVIGGVLWRSAASDSTEKTRLGEQKPDPQRCSRKRLLPRRSLGSCIKGNTLYSG